MSQWINHLQKFTYVFEEPKIPQKASHWTNHLPNLIYVFEGPLVPQKLSHWINHLLYYLCFWGAKGSSKTILLSKFYKTSCPCLCQAEWATRTKAMTKTWVISSSLYKGTRVWSENDYIKLVRAVQNLSGWLRSDKFYIIFPPHTVVPFIGCVMIM